MSDQTWGTWFSKRRWGLPIGWYICPTVSAHYIGIWVLLVKFQRCCWVFKSGWASSNVVGIIWPLVVCSKVNWTPKFWAHPAHQLAASLQMHQAEQVSNIVSLMLQFSCLPQVYDRSREASFFCCTYVFNIRSEVFLLNVKSCFCVAKYKNR